MGAPPAATALRDIPFRLADGSAATLGDWSGQVLLVVNTASECMFTPQYAGLAALQRAFAPRGFSVLAFPCNQFGAQEPGSASEVAAFCAARYRVDFPVCEKIEVNGPNAHPLFEQLKSAAPGWLGSRAIKWNFTKFLLGRSGEVWRRYGPVVSPGFLRGAIERQLDVG